MNQKKIGILTLYHKNFNMGGLLQAYALQKSLKKLGYDAEMIAFDYKRYYLINGKGSNTPKRSLLRKIVRKIRSFQEQKKDCFAERKKNFERFMKGIPHSSVVFYSAEEFSKYYETIIVGSDQVWGEWLPEQALRDFLLEGIDPKVEKYSYAASIGTDQINHKLDKIYIEALKKFKYVSVREVSAKKEIQKLLPKLEVSVDLDPTLLLTPDEWKTLINKQAGEKKYIFCYFLGKEREYREQAQKLAKRYNLPIVTMPYIMDNKIEGYDDEFGEYRDYSSGPEGFISAIYNAEIVITDSFHAMLFSSQFHKKFYVLARVNAETACTNKRITDYITQFGLEAQFIDVSSLNQIDIEKRVDFSVFDNKISGLRKQSLAYLKKI